MTSYGSLTPDWLGLGEPGQGGPSLTNPLGPPPHLRPPPKLHPSPRTPQVAWLFTIREDVKQKGIPPECDDLYQLVAVRTHKHMSYAHPISTYGEPLSWHHSQSSIHIPPPVWVLMTMA